MTTGDGNWAGKGVVVTGGFGVLGRAVVEAARAAGARVAALDFVAGPGEPLPADVVCLGGVDLADERGAAVALNAAAQALGEVHLLANVAGGFVWETVNDGGPATWERLFTMNLKTAVNASRAAYAHLARTGGAIVNVGANAAFKTAAGMGAYTASKAGVHRLTEALAEEWKGVIRVNAVAPSILDTPTNRADMPKSDFSKWVAPADLAQVMLFMGSDAARAVTGAVLPVVGGV